MSHRGGIRLPFAFVLIVVAALSALAPCGVDATPRTPPPSKACRRYTNYAPIESPGTAFDSAEACLDYADNGGTIVPVIAGYAPFLDLKIGSSDQPLWCILSGSMSGYASYTTYTIEHWIMLNNGSGTVFQITGWPATIVTTDRYGRASWSFTFEDGDSAYLMQERTVDGTVSEWRLDDC